MKKKTKYFLLGVLTLWVLTHLYVPAVRHGFFGDRIVYRPLFGSRR